LPLAVRARARLRGRARPANARWPPAAAKNDCWIDQQNSRFIKGL